MLKGKLLGTSILKGRIQREVITISKEEQDVVIEPRREQFDVYPDVGKVIKKATVKAVTSEIDENITASNIRGGVTILGVTGDLEPDKPDQSKVVEPSTNEQVITADSGYELASVTIKPVTAEIDSDIQPENIRDGVSVIGVVGTYIGNEKLFEKGFNIAYAKQMDIVREIGGGNPLVERDYIESEMQKLEATLVSLTQGE